MAAKKVGIEMGSLEDDISDKSSAHTRQALKDRIRYKRALSVDWDNVLKSSTRQSVVSRVHGDSQPKAQHPGSIAFEKPTANFCTNSSYAGEWDSIGMSGFGTYILPHGVEYEGNMQDGMFHGEGILTYPMGQKIDGKWLKGKLISWKFRFADGLEYEIPWNYCKIPDRRYHVCLDQGLRPAGREYLTNEQPTREIPEGCYDVGDGFYNPKTKCVTSAVDQSSTNEDEDNEATKQRPKRKVLRVPTRAEEEWIMENCRKAWDRPTGYKPKLYEHWVSGRATELNTFDDDTFDAVDNVGPPMPAGRSHSKKYSDTFALAVIVSPGYKFEKKNMAAAWWSQSPLKKVASPLSTREMSMKEIDAQLLLENADKEKRVLATSEKESNSKSETYSKSN